MPIPFILIAVAGYSLKKNFDAIVDSYEAEKYNNKAKEIYDKAMKKLENKEAKTNIKLARLGKLKIDIYSGSLMKFLDVFSQIKNINFEDNLQIETMIDLKETVRKIKDILGGDVAAIGSGILAGIGASALDTALIEAIIAGVNEALATKAKEAKYKAYQNYDKAKIAVKEIESICVVLDGLEKRTEEFINILNELDSILNIYIEKLKKTINISGKNYINYLDKEKKQVLITFSIAKTIKNICDTPIIDEKGEITQKSKEVLNKAREINRKIKEL